MINILDPYIMVPLVFTLKLIDDYIDIKIETIKRRPIFSPIQMNQFQESILVSNLVAYRKGRTFGIGRAELEQVARQIIRAQKELLK